MADKQFDYFGDFRGPITKIHALGQMVWNYANSDFEFLPEDFEGLGMSLMDISLELCEIAKEKEAKNYSNNQGASNGHD